MSIRTSFEFVSGGEQRRRTIRLHQNTRNLRLELFMRVVAASESRKTPVGGNLTRHPIASASGPCHERRRRVEAKKKFSINEDFSFGPESADDKSSKAAKDRTMPVPRFNAVFIRRKFVFSTEICIISGRGMRVK